jgi:integrase/recombinase XerD
MGVMVKFVLWFFEVHCAFSIKGWHCIIAIYLVHCAKRIPLVSFRLDFPLIAFNQHSIFDGIELRERDFPMQLAETYRMELRNRGYAPNTILAYSSAVDRFVKYHNESDLKPADQIPRFLDTIESLEARRIAWNAIRLFYTYVLKKPCPYTMEGIRPRHRLPNFLERDDVVSILGRIKNPKHALMISMLFGSGLRISELIHLRICDVDFNALTLKIVNAKQNKDRITVFSESLAPKLKLLTEGRTGQGYLFVTQAGVPYKRRTIQTIFSRALQESGLQKKASCHTLRHSFATSLLNNGIDIRSIKDLLGHKSVKTTMIYLHVTERSSKKIKSPL